MTTTTVFAECSMVGDDTYNRFMSDINKLKSNKRKNWKAQYITGMGVIYKMRFQQNKLVRYNPKYKKYCEILPFSRYIALKDSVCGLGDADRQFIKIITDGVVSYNDVVDKMMAHTHTGNSNGKARKIVNTKNTITRVSK